MRFEPCVCGGLIVATSSSDADIFGAVFRHNRTLGHQAWRAGGAA